MRLRAGPLLCLAALCWACGAEPAAQTVDCSRAIEPIASGFGAPGPHAVEALALPPDADTTLFLPAGLAQPVPVLLLAHAFNEGDPARYRALIDHLVGRGNAVVFPSYQGAETHTQRLERLWTGFEAALALRPARLDPSRMGFIGHSYGAGALPALALKALRDPARGEQGALLALLAPWFAVDVDAAALAAFPPRLKALVLVFEDDTANDHRIAIDLYHGLGLPAASKDYVLVRSDANGACHLPAVHTLPMSSGLRARDDALDTWVIFRLLDALIAAAFEGDAAAARVALGHGAPEQVTLGRWPDGTPMRPLVAGGDPQPSRDASSYLFRFEQRAEWLAYGAEAR